MKINNKLQMPTYDSLMNPLLEALYQIGGSGSIEEINEKLLDNLHLPDAIVESPHDPKHSNRTELEYRLAWTRTYLKKFGILENSKRGIYSLNWKGEGLPKVDPRDVIRAVREKDSVPIESSTSAKDVVELLELKGEEPEEIGSWRSELAHTLSKMDPSAFERLIMRMLRESGFSMVEVSARGADGGIDGKGIARIHGFLSFHVLFQCKRYQRSISADLIRDFRGAMVGRADKGLFVTTSTFTRDAIREATRDGASPIDLIDGEQLVEKLKELGLGVKIEMVEKVTVEKDWFASL